MGFKNHGVRLLNAITIGMFFAIVFASECAKEGPPASLQANQTVETLLATCVAENAMFHGCNVLARVCLMLRCFNKIRSKIWNKKQSKQTTKLKMRTFPQQTKKTYFANLGVNWKNGNPTGRIWVETWNFQFFFWPGNTGSQRKMPDGKRSTWNPFREIVSQLCLSIDASLVDDCCGPLSEWLYYRWRGV